MNNQSIQFGLPTRQKAEELLSEAESHNVGPWGNHSRNVAKCAEKIAVACGLDGNKAYILGLLHDIGRKFGARHLGHIYDGYKYMLELGYVQAAKICLTHSFLTQNMKSYIGKFDISESDNGKTWKPLSMPPYTTTTTGLFSYVTPWGLPTEL